MKSPNPYMPLPVTNDLAIRLHGVSKSFRVYQRPMDRLLQGAFGGVRQRYTEFQAVRTLDLQIGRGETVGIVGRNGSGKSTLLQLIAGTLAPTTGQVEVNGKVAALLELGSGFNPDFTGRENVHLNGIVLGLTTAEIAERFDRIVAFSELAEFIDRPVKTYSSGMYMRLAFAVAIHVDPDILIVDEALSVGDAAFQRKCFARIEQLKANGTTILFVSHSQSHVIELCDRAVLMEHGARLLTGKPKRVVDLYQKLIYAPSARQTAILEQIGRADAGEAEPEIAGAAFDEAQPDDDADGIERYEDLPPPSSAIEYPRQGACISNPRIVNTRGKCVNVLCAGSEYSYRYEVDFDAACRAVRFGMMIKSVTGIELFGMASHAHRESIAVVIEGARYEVEFRFVARLQPGMYFLNAGCSSIGDTDHQFLHRLIDALMFRVESASNRVMVGYADLSVEPACNVAAVLEHETESQA